MLQNEETLQALDREAKKRREEVTLKAKQPLPEFLRSIESTTVYYTVDPDILPFSLVDPLKLATLLGQRFGLRFKPPQFDLKRLETLGIDPTKTTEEGLLRYMLQGDSPTIAFNQGRYPTGPDSFVLIEELAFSREIIAAKVKGITEVAQQVIAEAFAIFWESAGAGRRWDSTKTQDRVYLVSFSSVTMIDLGERAELLVCAPVRNVMNREIGKSQGLGVAMLPFSAYDNFAPNPNAIASWSFQRLVLNVHVFDPPSGRTITAQLDVDTKATGDRGRGVVELSTELPFDLHVDIARTIRSVLSEQISKVSGSSSQPPARADG